VNHYDHRLHDLDSVMPRRSSNDHPPDEAQFFTAVQLAQELAERRRQAQAVQAGLSREQSCEKCLARVGPAEEPAAEWP
jgi:hypothetical protein